MARDTTRIILLAGLFVATLLIWYALSHDNGKLTVAFLNVGQGDSIFIEAPGGNQILIDGGPDRKVVRELSRLMPFFDRSIDVVIATHPDLDHIGGLPDVFDRFRVSMFIESGVPGESGADEALLEKVEEEGAERVFAKGNMSLTLGGGAYLHVLFPDRDAAGLETNTSSLVAKLVYGDHEFLLTGDSPKNIEAYLVNRFGEKLESDVLKAGHHGSKTSTSESFLAAVHPLYTVISAGESNRYGHPHAEVTERLLRNDVTVVETKNGTIVFMSDGETLTHSQ